MDYAVSLTVPESHKELQGNVYKKCDLSYDIEYEKVLWETSEESKLHWREERRVNCPYQYEMLPCPIKPALIIYIIHSHSFLFSLLSLSHLRKRNTFYSVLLAS